MTRTMKTHAAKLFPFLRWFPLSTEKLRADRVAGITVAFFYLIKIRPLLMVWKVDRMGAVAGVFMFVATLSMVPSIANGVLAGVALTIIIFLMRRMKPRAVLLGQMPDGSLADMKAHALPPVSPHFVIVRYGGSLDFLNAAHFEDVILRAHADFPRAKTMLVIGNGINNIDASGEEKIREIAKYMHEAGVKLAFGSLKHPVREKFDSAGLQHLLGAENVFKKPRYRVSGIADALRGWPACRCAPDSTGKMKVLHATR